MRKDGLVNNGGQEERAREIRDFCDLRSRIDLSAITLSRNDTNESYLYC